MFLKVVTVENRNEDKEISDFLQSERRVYERRQIEETPYLQETVSRRTESKKKITRTEKDQLKEKWKQEGRKEFKIASHNINGLKTKGWKLGNLIEWAESEEITILGITETNMSEREGKFLAHGLNMRYKGYWTSAAQDKKKRSDIGILIEKK